MHYWMLVFRHQFPDGGFFDIAIPTCYYNYEQFVSSAHVDFEMKDVSELSAKLVPLHNMITNQILATSFQSDIQSLFGVQFEPLSVDVGTLHRHPGGSASQRFSGTDLDANETHHGIVFPLRSGTDKPSFSGILAIDSGECNVAHYEYRLVNGSYDTSDLSYIKGRCLAITQNNTYVAPTLTSIQQFFGCTQPTAPLKLKTDQSLVPTNVIDSLNDLISILPDPNIQCVRPEHVKTKPVIYTTYGKGWANNIVNSVPYKLDFTKYQYNITLLVNNLERHYDFHKISYVSANLHKMPITEIQSRLTAVYAMPDPKAAPAPKSDTPPTAFTLCPIAILTDIELALASKETLAVHYDKLDAYYYGKPGPSILETEPAITRAELIDYILELYLNIYDEEQEDAANVSRFNFDTDFDYIG